ncbi:o-succinylbenzoate synthase [Edaphobacillus lindanitolerans]|uniref:o-succinylbenzoate synthase n=1 Tax=Edaphobacillus lindanitolerans TaxID=550447 RepID=A0A1U7PKN6_9BACI|nr:o-succinylbenzoate synthase [Edaphobacillus lindanitolerans]SIT72440.1 O-succinylbenzoate synthase [Edaphobacillus lindanitolerans]
MKTINLKEVRLHHINVSLIAPFTTSFGTMENKDVCLVEVVDESGVSGWGETVTSNEPYYNEETTETAVYMLKDFFIPRLLHREIGHPSEVHGMLEFVRRNNIAKAAIETAIWDAFAKKNGLSIAELIGGTKKEIESGKSIGIQESPEVLVKKVDQYVREGFRKIKVKIKPGADIEYMRAVREAFPDIALMADANSAYTLDDADHLKQLDELDLLMIEQPLAHDDIIDHAKLQKQIKTPVCLDESIHSYEDARKAIELGSCRIINIKIGRVGGLQESKRIHDLCMENGIDVWCGGMLETGVGRAHNIQMTTLPNFTIPGDTAPSSHYWTEDIVTPEIEMHNGLIRVPDGAGIGYEVDPQKLAKVIRSEERITSTETPHPIPN